MTTPVYDFIRRYAASDAARLHMPGHKGKTVLGCEALDLTEVAGADSLYEAEGILAEGEANTAALFGSGKTLWSTEGSSQCIRAMVYLALLCRPSGRPPLLLAGRNAHKSFLYAAALCGAEVSWLWPEERKSLCACEITPDILERALSRMPEPPAAVYITSPDYLGNLADVSGLAAVCRSREIPLLADNAHGAYLRFLPESLHPMQCGAAMCCDSAHKTLPVLTGGAYLHLSRELPPAYSHNAKAAMEMFGSTSPSYLTLASLDLCNRYLSGEYPALLGETAERLDHLRRSLRQKGWNVERSDPLRVTLRGDGFDIAARLRQGNIEPEYADRDYCVLMATPENTPEELARVDAALGNSVHSVEAAAPRLPAGRCERIVSPREALFAPQETVPAAAAEGRICGAPCVSCPPAIPIVVSGERISGEAVRLLSYYSVSAIRVLK